LERRGLAQVSDTALIEKLCDEVLAANPRTVADYKAGKAAALNFLKGQVMKLSKGKANPGLVGEALLAKLTDRAYWKSIPFVTPGARCHCGSSRMARDIRSQPADRLR
jgi:hypothetical protein